MTFIYTDHNGVEWAVTSYGMTRLFRKRTPWIRFTQWVKRILAGAFLAWRGGRR